MLQAESSREPSDSFPHNGFKNPVEVMFRKTSGPGDFIQREVSIQILADEVHRLAHASLVIRCGELLDVASGTIRHLGFTCSEDRH